MPIKAPPKITAWSYSRLNDYEKCPALAKYKHVDKIREPPNDAMMRGTKMHETAGLYATGQTKKLPEELALFPDEFAEFRKNKKILNIEQQLATNVSWRPSDWFGADAWLRVVFDLEYTLGDRSNIIDWKSGKVRAEHEDQLDLYAIVRFAYSKTIDVVDAAMHYLDQGEVNAKSYTRAEAEKLKPVWLKRVKPMLSDRAFKPTPGEHCRWCFFNAKKRTGAPCKVGQ